MRQQLNSSAEELDSVRSELQTSKGKQASLEALQQAALGQDNQEINTWLKSKGLGNEMRLAEGLRIESGWEKAVEAVLGESLQAICVEGLDKVEQLLSDLPKGKLGLIDVTRRSGVNRESNEPLILLASKASGDWDVSDLLKNIYIANSLS